MAQSHLEASKAVASTTTPIEPITDPVPGKPIEQLEVEEPGATNADTEIVYPTGTKLWLNYSSLCLTAFIRGIDITIVAVAVPSITNEFHTINDIGWYNAAYMMTASALVFFFGKIYTVFPVTRTYQYSILAYMLAAVVCTFANSSKLFIVGRALGGMASAWQGGGLITQLNMAFPLHKRPTYIGYIGFIGAAGLCAAPPIGGGLIQRFGWRACFGISIPTNFIGFLFARYSMEENLVNPDTKLPFKEKMKRLDFTGTLFFVPALTCLLMALQWGGIKFGWNDARIIVLLVLSIVLLAIFGYIQYVSGDKAAVPLRILKQRSVLAGALFATCCDGTLAVTENYLSIYFQGVRGYTAAYAGLLGVPLVVGLMASSPLAGLGITKIGYYTPFMFFTAILAPIASGLLTTLDLDSQPGKAAGLVGMLGFALGLGMNGPSVAISCILPTNEVAIGTAILGFGAGMGSALFSSVAALLFQRRLADEVRQSSPQANVTQISHAGLSEIRTIVGPDILKSVLRGYDTAVSQTLYLPVALTCLTIVGAALTEWRTVKQKKA